MKRFKTKMLNKQIAFMRRLIQEQTYGRDFQKKHFLELSKLSCKKCELKRNSFLLLNYLLFYLLLFFN
jgi:hypothetical protein